MCQKFNIQFKVRRSFISPKDDAGGNDNADNNDDENQEDEADEEEGGDDDEDNDGEGDNSDGSWEDVEREEIIG